MRLDSYLYDKKLFSSRTKAAEAINKGLVKVNGVMAKPSTEADENSKIEIIERLSFVSNGGYKLERARTEFGLDFSGKVFADIGASTGGYTDCLLKSGAAKVFAVDVGENQLDPSIAENPKVVVMDKTNARNLKTCDFDKPLDGITVDCSFISLKLLLKPLSELLSDGKTLIALIKPQFECDAKQRFKNGIIRDKKIHVSVCEGIYDFAISCSLTPVNFTNAPIIIGKNNEFLMQFIKNGAKTMNKDRIKAVISGI